MATVLFHTTMSLDGFTTAAGGDMSWLADHAGGGNPTVTDLLGRIGSVLLGGRTWRGDGGAASDEGKPYGGAITVPQVVLTSRPPAAAVPGVEFAADLGAAIAAARRAAGDRYGAVLGAETARSCLAAGELDEVLVHVAPVLLGDGVPLFRQPGGEKVRLEQLSVTHTARVTNL
ncbi:dihydrofolate reductase family protein [Plantactinospora siamensis]|uniref:Dihydrofolate reductase family protein n=1 Tax=Plantactinospora siamensis TaxID=555372 RepID=A0ABV6NZF5_9ACTN